MVEGLFKNKGTKVYWLEWCTVHTVHMYREPHKVSGLGANKTTIFLIAEI
jgi:hypothetical protein